MTGVRLLGFSAVFVAWIVLISAPARAAECENLVKLNLSDVTITSATNMPAGRFTPPGPSNALETPAFCHVVAVARPTSDSVINLEVWIPPAEQWNHNFLGVGNGGYRGAISYGALANARADGGKIS
jgi:feruloyl esterase